MSRNIRVSETYDYVHQRLLCNVSKWLALGAGVGSLALLPVHKSKVVLSSMAISTGVASVLLSNVTALHSERLKEQSGLSTFSYRQNYLQALQESEELEFTPDSSHVLDWSMLLSKEAYELRHPQLMLHGETGAGKTILLEAIAHAAPGSVVICSAHKKWGEFPGQIVVGAAFNSAEEFSVEPIEDAVHTVWQEMRRRLALLGTPNKPHFAPLTLCIDEVPVTLGHASKTVEGSRSKLQITQDISNIAEEGRKVAVRVILNTQEGTVAALGWQGRSALLEQFTHIYLAKQAVDEAWLWTRNVRSADVPTSYAQWLSEREYPVFITKGNSMWWVGDSLPRVAGYTGHEEKFDATTVLQEEEQNEEEEEDNTHTKQTSAFDYEAERILAKLYAYSVKQSNVSATVKACCSPGSYKETKQYLEELRERYL